MQTRIIKGKEHVLYNNKDEARQVMSLEDIHEDWRVAPLNSWVLTDDEQVCQILERGELNGQAYVRTVVGMFKCAPTSKMSGEMRPNIYNFSGLFEEQRVLNKEKPSKQEYIFARYIAKGEGVTDAFKKAFPDAKSEKYIKRRTSLLLRTERISTLIEKEIEKILHKTDITPEYLLQKTKDIVDSEEARDSDKLASIKILMEISGILGKKEQKTESIQLFQGFTPEQLAVLEGGNNVKKIAEQTRELPDMPEED
tara:strand:- start:454 stop:1215 length:762 start_codon:yes stop_codon:yes gene_type:complete